MDDEVGDYTRTRAALPSVSHYHGDIVRQLFISAAALMVLAAPFYGDNLGAEIPFLIGGAIVLVALAALTNPHGKQMFFANAVASGIGLLVYETWALGRYDDSTWIQFILREFLAVMFLVAFYFSMKTVRASIFRQIGKHDTVGEFDEAPRERKESLQKPNPESGHFNPYIRFKSKAEKQFSRAEENERDEQARRTRIEEERTSREQAERDMAEGRA